jgi:thiamine transport system permease protein
MISSRAESGAAVTVGLVVLLVATAFAALIFAGAGDAAGWPSVTERSLWSAARFTLLQAALSTLLSISLAVPVARALARRTNFLGRRAILTLLTIPMALPQLVAVLGLVAIYGRTGWIAQVGAAAGIRAEPNIYGLSGILLAHVFFNLPFAVLLLLARLESIPGETWRLASQLALPAGAIFRVIEWPALCPVLPGVAAVVFLICVTSFTIVLTLGGGPAATTLEVAIYQALRFDFDPPRAVVLALIQMLLCLLLILSLRQLGQGAMPMPSLGRRVARPDAGISSGRFGDALAVVSCVLFIGLPIIAIAATGLSSQLPRLLTEPLVWRAIGSSLAIAFCAMLLALAGGWSLVVAGRSSGPLGPWARLATDGGGLLLVVPPFVIGAGWFLLLNRFGLAFTLAPVLVVLINALMALPYAARILSAADAALPRDNHRLCANLGITGWTRFRLIDGPLLARPFAFAGALTAALSLGDLGIAALFGSERLTTLPLLLQQRMGSYRAHDAESLALILAALCLSLFVAADLATRRGQRP